MIKIGELLRKLWSLRSCFNILPPRALTPQGIEGAMKRDVSKHWCTLSDVPAEVDLLRMRVERHARLLHSVSVENFSIPLLHL